MRVISLLLLLSISCFAFEYDNDVMVLDEGSYQEAVDQFEYLLLEFYAPWCGHCQKLAPEYEKAARVLKEEGIVLAKVDASVHRKLAEAQGVNGYPTLKFLTQGKEVKFDGGRTADGIKQWIFSHINPGSEQLNSTAQIQEAIDQSEVLFFYLADEPVGSGKDREFRRYREFSYTIKGTKFAHTHLKDARAALNLPKSANFVVFKNFDNKMAVYNGKLKIPEMKSFVELNSIERVISLQERADWVFERVFSKDRPAVIHFTNGENDDHLREAAFAYPAEDYLLFVRVTSDQQDALLERLQIKEADAEGGVFLVARNGTQKFKLNKVINKENVLGFVEDWKNGKANRYLKSQEAPATESSGPVTHLVGSTYESEVLQGSKDFVVLYYDSSNSEHEAVQRQFEQSALRLRKSRGLSFAKIDCSLNEVPDMQDSLEVTKIRLYKGESNDRQQVKFVLRANKVQEERLVKWIRENSSTDVADPKGDL